MKTQCTIWCDIYIAWALGCAMETVYSISKKREKFEACTQGRGFHGSKRRKRFHLKSATQNGRGQTS